MSDLTIVLLAAGNSSRFKIPVKKQWLRVGHDPLWLYVTNRIKSFLPDTEIIIAAHPDEISFMSPLCDVKIIEGGASRQNSLQNALNHVTSPYVLVSDAARACIGPELIGRLMEHREEADCIVPALPVNDTVSYYGETIDRSALFRIQTPQLSRTEILRKALATDIEYTDDSSAIVAYGGTRLLVEGDPEADKLTLASDSHSLGCLQPPATVSFTGNGFDVHGFEEGKTMVLGGITIESPFGFKAHSDGDVAIHALIDALLGAACLGDIGTLFPDSDDTYKNIDSKKLLEQCVALLHRLGFVITHADITVIAQTPRLASYKESIRKTLASLMLISPARVNVKATTTENLGFIGRKEGVGVLATATVHYYNWTAQ